MPRSDYAMNRAMVVSADFLRWQQQVTESRLNYLYGMLVSVYKYGFSSRASSCFPLSTNHQYCCACTCDASKQYWYRFIRYVSSPLFSPNPTLPFT